MSGGNDRRFERALDLQPENQELQPHEFAFRECVALRRALLDPRPRASAIACMQCQSSLFILSTQRVLHQHRPDRVGRVGNVKREGGRRAGRRWRDAGRPCRGRE